MNLKRGFVGSYTIIGIRAVYRVYDPSFGVHLVPRCGALFDAHVFSTISSKPYILSRRRQGFKAGCVNSQGKNKRSHIRFIEYLPTNRGRLKL